MLKKIYHNKVLFAALLSCLLGCLIVIPNIIINGGIYHLVADFDLQEIPFHKIMNDSLKNGEILWNWYNDLGSNFIGTYSFYNLGSPFNMVFYLFPSTWYEYLVGPIFILKYTICGMTSFLFLKRYVKNKDYAVLGSLLYTFSGFQLTNILFFQFHDVVAFFPLLLYTLDELVLNHKKGWFALVVLLCAFMNWFFLIGEILFTIIYFIVKWIAKEYKINKMVFLQVLFEGIMGTCMAMFILFPTLLFTESNPRIQNNWTIIYALRFSFTQYFEILRGLLTPPETMSNRAFLTIANYDSVEAFLPVVGMVFGISYILKNPKKSHSIITILSILFMLIPILNSSFFLFTTKYYARWFYMPILFLSLISIKAIEENIPIKKGIIVTILGCISLILGSILFSTKHKIIIQSIPYIIIVVGITLISLIATYKIEKQNNKKFWKYLTCIFIYVTLFGNYMIYQYQNNSLGLSTEYKEYLKQDQKLIDTLDGRSNSTDSCYPNMSLTKRIHNIKSFNSNINGSSFSFYNSIGYQRETSTMIPMEDTRTNDILGVKYIIACGEDSPDTYGYEEYDQIGNYRIYKNNDYNEFGFSAINYLSNEDFLKLSIEERKTVLLDHIILTEEQIKKYKDLYQNETKYISNSFSFNKNGFISKITSTKDTLAIYQVPFDTGWTAKVNGKNVKIEKVDNGFMAIRINEGENLIKFTYQTPGLGIGMIISIVYLLEYLFYILYNPKKKTKKES